MAFADLNLTVELELSIDEIVAMDRALSMYVQVAGAKDDIARSISLEVKDLIEKVAPAIAAVNTANGDDDIEYPTALPMPSEDEEEEDEEGEDREEEDYSENDE